MNDKPLSTTQLEQFQRDGFIILRSLFDAEEIELLGRAAKDDRVLDQNSFGRNDGSGGNIRLSLWSDPGDNLYGMFARCPRIVGAMEQILGGPVGHYHSKMIMKDAKVGGAWEWHQDYGYWYDIGYLSPDLASVMIAVDKATKENGCLQVIKGSHRLGRINHTATGQQAGADLTRVREVLGQAGAGALRDGSRRRRLFSQQYAPPQRSKSLRTSALGDDLLLLAHRQRFGTRSVTSEPTKAG